MANAVEPWRDRKSQVTGCRLAGITVGVLVLGIVLSQIPDLIRFFRMSNM
jgi:hypothetical protein